MQSPEIQEFAELFILEVRDEALRNAGILLRPTCRSPSAKRWRAVLEGVKPGIAEALIADCVDEALGVFLGAIDEGVLRLAFRASSGKTVDLAAEGLGGLRASFLGGDGGWRAVHSKERFVDYGADVEMDSAPGNKPPNDDGE